MPLPNFGFQNKEKKEHQELKFQMAPEYVDVEVDSKLSGMHTVKYFWSEYVCTLIEVHTSKYALVQKYMLLGA